jgi:hypothetical protein
LTASLTALLDRLVSPSDVPSGRQTAAELDLVSRQVRADVRD